MPNRKKTKSISIPCRYGNWILTRRGGDDGVFQADGRSNPVSFGRHSLGTRDLAEAKDIIHDLDLRMAVEKGLASPRLLSNQRKPGTGLSIEAGLTAYRKYMKRPRAAGGPKKSTQDRYERGLKAFEQYCKEEAIRFFEQLNADCLNDFVKWRQEPDATTGRKASKESSVITELGLIRRVHNHLIAEGFLDSTCAFRYKLRTQKESTRYCPTPAELKAILETISSSPECQWLRNATLLISHTGMRLSEAAELSWSDVEFTNNCGEGFLHVRDESFRGIDAKSTKSGYSRKVPIHPSLSPVLCELANDKSAPRVLQGPRGGKLRSDTFGDELRRVALKPLQHKITHDRFQTITAHSLRHFFSSIGAANNISQQTVMDWMGQRTPSMAKRYFHRNDEASLKNIKKIEPILDVQSERTDDTLSNPDEPEADDSNANDTDQD